MEDFCVMLDPLKWPKPKTLQVWKWRESSLNRLVWAVGGLQAITLRDYLEICWVWVEFVCMLNFKQPWNHGTLTTIRTSSLNFPSILPGSFDTSLTREHITTDSLKTCIRLYRAYMEPNVYGSGLAPLAASQLQAARQLVASSGAFAVSGSTRLRGVLAS